MHKTENKSHYFAEFHGNEAYQINKRTTGKTPISISAEIIANNNDLLAEILGRLPVKSLPKFKCVSKQWLSLISIPRFFHRLKPYTNSPCALFLQKSSHRVYDFVSLDSVNSNAPFKTLKFVNDQFGIKILQSCNGLLLCCNCRGNALKRKHYIYNPSTKQYTILPPLPVTTGVVGLSLAFDPSTSPHYKVICAYKSSSSQDLYQIQIYSSESGPWRASATSPFTATGIVDFNGGVFWNGVIHWISSWGESLRFDVDQEQIAEMPMPVIPNGWDHRKVSYFGESGGHLHLIEIYGSNVTEFDVYEMERDYSGWFVKYHVSIDAVAGAFPEMVGSYLNPELKYYALDTLCVVRGETHEDSFLVLHIPGKIICYNFKDNSFKKLRNYSPGNNETEQEA